MSYTSWKRKLAEGTELSLINIRRPWKSRNVTVEVASKRFVMVRDDDNLPARIELVPAAFTRVLDDDCVAFLAKEDGPSWHAPDRPTKDGIPAGTPWLRVKVLSDGS